MRKPDPEIYELTMSRLGVAAPQCLFVDDREDNCEGALAVGMCVVRYEDAEQATAEIRAVLNGGRGSGRSPGPRRGSQLSEPRRSHR